MSKSGITEHWFVLFDNGQPSLQTASYTRRGAINHWLNATNNNRDWKFWRSHGMTAKRAKIKWQVQE